MVWRTNSELLVKCNSCSAENLQGMQLDFFAHEITVLGGYGQRIDPRLLRSRAPCLDSPGRFLGWLAGDTAESSGTVLRIIRPCSRPCSVPGTG